MHRQVEIFVEEVKAKFPGYFDRKHVLEVGSLNVNGSVRKYFTNCNYIGIDLAPGPGVDMIMPIHELDLPGKHLKLADTIISTEMLEHDRHWQESLKSMYKNLQPGGLLLITCAGPRRAEHGTTRTETRSSPFTTDYYANMTIPNFQRILPPSLFSEYDIRLERRNKDFVFWGIKHNT